VESETVAVIVIWVPLLAEGAVKIPSLEIEPADDDQDTEVLLVPLTVAVNCCCAPGDRVRLAGEIATWTCVAGCVL
jgi:hypothetical protein